MTLSNTFLINVYTLSLFSTSSITIPRVKKISEQSVAEAAVRMLENDTLEVPSPSTEKYKLSAIQNGEMRNRLLSCAQCRAGCYSR